MAGVLEYTTNNSGGDWWLDTDAWKRLEDAGWTVHWYHDFDEQHGDVKHTGPRPKFGEHSHSYGDDVLVAASPSGEDFIGALATSAAKRFDSPSEGVDEWERVTGENASDEGCNCCGEPHSFRFTRDDGTTSYTSIEVTETSLNWS